MHYQQMLRKYLPMQTQVKQKWMQWLNVSKTSWRKFASSTDHATPANDQAAQKPAVAPATTQAAANASQEAATNARKAAKELPNTGTADSTVAMVAAAASALLGLGLAGRRRKEDEEA